MALLNLRSPIQAASVTAAGDYKNIQAALRTHEHSLYDSNVARQLMTAGIESDEALIQDLETSYTTTQGIIQDVFKDMGLSQVGIESAARTAMLLGDVDSLRNSLQESHLAVEAGLEDFDSVDLGQYRAATIAANALAGEGTGLLEQLYPVIEVGANYGGIKIELRRFCKVNNVVNPGTGEPVSWNRQHITEAYRDDSILGGSYNKLYPILITSTNEAYFADTHISGINEAQVPDHPKLRTAPLKPVNGKRINLLGLSRVPSPTGAEQDKHTYNDRINEGARLNSVFFEIKNGEDTAIAFEFSLANYNQAQFIRGAETGRINETKADLDIDKITLNLKSELAQSHKKLKAISELGYSAITFSLVLSAKLNLHSGDFHQTFGEPEISGLYKDNDPLNYVADPTAKSKLAELTPKYVGFTIDATLSSKTLRLRGERVDDETIPYTFNIKAHSPFTGEKAITETNVLELTSLMASSELIRRENEAVRHCHDNIVRLAGELASDSIKLDPHGSNMVGLAYIAKPWIKHETIELSELVNELESRYRRENIAAGLVHLLGDRAMAMVTETVYIENLRTYTKDPAAKASFKLLAPRNLGRYLYTEGDDRTFGAADADIESKPTVLTTSLQLMDDKIIMIPAANTGGRGETLDVFAWGNCLRGTTLTYDVEIQEGQGTKRFLQLQPFYDFTINCPMAYMLEVKGLAAYLKSKASILVKNSAE